MMYHRQNIPLVLTASLVLGVVVLAYWHQGNRRDRAEAERARAFLADQTASRDQELQKFSLTGFDEKGHRFWKLEGDAARIDPSQRVFLKDNVTLRLKDDTLIRTDHVEWSQATGILKTDARVFVTHRNARIRGEGALGEPAKNFVQLNRRIEMTVDGTTITCAGPMKVFYGEDRLVFYRDVKAVDARGVLRAKRMDVFFDDQEERKIDRIVAIGDVTIERGGDVTRSQRAVYSFATGSLRLEGNPEVILQKGSEALLNATSRNAGS